MRRWTDIAHLARRFIGQLDRSSPPGWDEAWAKSLLSAPEQRLFVEMGPADRRHAIEVAIKVDIALAGDQAELSHDRSTVLRAALLHDVGKIEARLGPIGRSIATVVEMTGLNPHLERLSGPVRKRLVSYRDYPMTGARWLQEAGSPELVSAWAAEHHNKPAQWSVPVALGELLAAADDC